MMTFLLVGFAVLLIIGAPIAVCMGLTSMVGVLVFGGSNFVTIGQRVFEGMNSFSLLAIPLFSFAGLLMGSGGIGQRLVDFCYALVGRFTGGLAHVNVLASMLFSGTSGSAAADTAYECAITMPPMVAKGYSKPFTVAVTAISSTIGIVLPPSIPMIIIAGILGISTGQVFMGGVIPGILVGVSQMVVSYFYAKKNNVPKETAPFSWKSIWKSFKESFFALVELPLVMVGITSGIVSATEAGLLATAYALVVGGLIYKELNWEAMKEALMTTVKTSAKVFFIIGTAALFGKLLTLAGFHSAVTNLILGISGHPTVVLLMIMLIMLLVGTFMESISSITLFMPVFYPIALQVGIDPVVLSVLVVCCIGIGLVTPPEGMCIYIAADFLKVPIWDATKALMPFILLNCVVIAILIAFPILITGPASLVAVGVG